MLLLSTHLTDAKRDDLPLISRATRPSEGTRLENLCFVWAKNVCVSRGKRAGSKAGSFIADGSGSDRSNDTEAAPRAVTVIASS